MANEAERAKAGATYMDANCVGWPEKIAADRLDLSRCEDCVLGQAFDGHYLSVKCRLELTSQQAAALGFCSEVSNEHTFASYMVLPPEAKTIQRQRINVEHAALRLAWLAEIDARLCTVDETESSPVATWESPL